MAARLKGTAFHLGESGSAKQLSFDRFFEWMKARNGVAEWPYIPRDGNAQGDAEHEMRMYCDDDDKTWFGVLVTTRTDKHNLYPQQQQGGIVIVPRTVNGVRPVEANFFRVRKDSHNGLYGGYRGSCGFSCFLADVWRSYVAFARETTAACGGHGDAWRPRYNMQSLASPEGFRSLVQSMREMTTVAVTTYRAVADGDEPVGANIKSVRREYRLQDASPTGLLLDWIGRLRDSSYRGTRKAEGRPHGCVRGTTHNGAAIAIDFFQTLDDYLGLTHDDIESIDTARLGSDNIIQILGDRLHEHHLFGIEVT